MPIHTGSVAAAAAARATGVKAFKDSGPLSLRRGGGSEVVGGRERRGEGRKKAGGRESGGEMSCGGVRKEERE